MMGLAADKRAGAGADVARQEGGSGENGKGKRKGGREVDGMGIEKVKDKRLRGLFGEFGAFLLSFLICFALFADGLGL